MTTKADAPALLDIMTRHQIYLEGVKENQYKRYDELAVELRKAIREVFLDIDYADMSQFTKRELDLFIRKLRLAQIAHYNTFIQQVLRDLEGFTKVNTQVNVTILQDTQEEADELSDNFSAAKLALLVALLAPKGQTRLWASILNSPVPANGMLPERFIEGLMARGLIDTENLMRKARANNLTVKQALQMFTGTDAVSLRDGLLARMRPQAEGIIATLWQHADSLVKVPTMSVYFDHYRWVSVIDNRTSKICLSRNGKIYRFGDGPLPPAHYFCRSGIEPVDPSEVESPASSYYAWLARQPKSVQDDILGRDRADALRNGDLSETDLPKFSDAAPLTNEEFLGKLDTMLD